MPSEVVVDPWLVPLAYARHAHENGATIRRGTEVTAAAWADGCWQLRLEGREEQALEEARLVVACGGLRGDVLESLHRAPPFAIRPRRGDYVLFDETAALGDTPIGQVASEVSRGAYVWRSVHGVVSCGPTAEPVSERATPPSPTTASVRDALVAAAAL